MLDLMGTPPRVHAGREAAAFTLIELLVLMGVIAVLVSLVIPSLSASLERSRRVRDAAQLRQNYSLVTLYVNDAGDTFPVAHSLAIHSAMEWYKALLATGHLGSPAEADPIAYRRYQFVSFHMSMCLAADPDQMLPGRSMWAERLASKGVRLDQVTFPSQKGMMFQRSDSPRTYTEGGNWFCCGYRWPAPVVFGDGAVEIADSYRYTGGQYPTVVDGIGVPVWSSWGGCRARDK